MLSEHSWQLLIRWYPSKHLTTPTELCIFLYRLGPIKIPLEEQLEKRSASDNEMFSSIHCAVIECFEGEQLEHGNVTRKSLNSKGGLSIQWCLHYEQFAIVVIIWTPTLHKIRSFGTLKCWRRSLNSEGLTIKWWLHYVQHAIILMRTPTLHGIGSFRTTGTQKWCKEVSELQRTSLHSMMLHLVQ